MPCSYERYDELLRPSKFYMAGISRVRAGVLFAPLLLLLIPAKSSSLIVSAMAMPAAFVWAAVTNWTLNRSRVRHWSKQCGRRLRDTTECIAFIVERRVDGLLAMFAANHAVALKEMAIELAHAENELRNRRAQKPSRYRWAGMVLLALLTPALTLLTQAPSQVVIELLCLGALLVGFALFFVMLVDEAFDVRGDRYAGYVQLLRLGSADSTSRR